MRVHWEDIPLEVRAVLERRLGARVVEALTQPGGFSPGLAARLRLADGRRAFLKAVSEEANPDTPGMHRREAEIVAALPAGAPVPRLLWTYDDSGWVALCFEDVEGRHPSMPWSESDLDLLVSALQRLAAELTPSPIDAGVTVADALVENINGWRRAHDRGETRLDAWCLRHLERLADLEAKAPAASTGETLLQFDARADNILIAGERVYFVDWPHARIGAPWVEWVALAPSVEMQGGPPAANVLARFDVAAVPRKSIDAVLCSLAGYFTVRALDPPPAGIPTVRAFQAAQGVVAVRWLRERLGWP